MWEELVIDTRNCVSTYRMKVDGGYLYTKERHNLGIISMCFVPDVDLTRYQSHLRDAYTQGFDDGMKEAHANLSAAMNGEI